MSVFEIKTRIEVPVKELFDWHNRFSTFMRLTPSWEKTRVLTRQGAAPDAERQFLEIKQGYFRRKWTSVSASLIDGRQFCDEQVLGPYKKWIHTHKFLPESETASRLEDHVEFKPPLFFLGEWLLSGSVKRKLAKVFNFRHARTRNDLRRYSPFAKKGPLRIVMSGGSGFIGKELSTFLSCAGHQVQFLVRRTPQPQSSEIFWDPYRKELDKVSLESVDAVIHLAGENIGNAPWDERKKLFIRESRVQGTRFLAETLASLKNPPKVMLCASAVGYYGDRGEESLSEESSAGKGFLPEVCRAWEEAAEAAVKAGIRVVNVRTGLVLSGTGGALVRMLPYFNSYTGGVVGSGDQWVSWISMEDLVGIYLFLMHTDYISGPVNATSPKPVTNHVFTKKLGKVLKKPTIFSLPASIVKARYGEMGEALMLHGQRVKPDKLSRAGFEFLYADLEAALGWELGR
jgi:uncharacterized protein (TIGR01777 family)